MRRNPVPEPWVPRRGDIVRLKPGFDQTLEAMAARRAGLPLEEGFRYEVLGCERSETGLLLTLRQVRVVRVGGIRQVATVGWPPFPYVSERFEPV